MNGATPFFRVDIDLRRIGQLLREAREDMHLSTRELSKLAGMSATQISRMEAGADFAVTKLVKLAVPLGLQPSYLIDRSLIVPTIASAVETSPVQYGFGELAVWFEDLRTDDDIVTTTDMKGVLDFAGMSACLLLLSMNPKATLDFLVPPLASLRRTLEQFIEAYGPQTEPVERAAVLRAIAQRPVQKLKALGIISQEVVAEYVEQFREEWRRVSSRLNLGQGSVKSDSVPTPTSEWAQLVARVVQATAQYGTRARLARDLGVTSQAVHQWLNGASAPSAELTLRLLQWVTAAEAKQK